MSNTPTLEMTFLHDLNSARIAAEDVGDADAANAFAAMENLVADHRIGDEILHRAQGYMEHHEDITFPTEKLAPIARGIQVALALDRVIGEELADESQFSGGDQWVTISNQSREILIHLDGTNTGKKIKASDSQAQHEGHTDYFEEQGKFKHLPYPLDFLEKFSA